MKRFIFLLLIINAFNGLFAQNSQYIKDMKWEEDSKLFLSLENDSNFILNIEDLFHSSTKPKILEKDGYTYYPAAIGEQFINQLKDKNIEIDTSNILFRNEPASVNITLWSAIHSSLGGGWVHFINALLYSLETRQLSITAPLMKRPVSNWKPKPVTESYKRTRKWEYYVPVNQKLAVKEYKLRKEEGKLGDINNIPEQYIELFLNTNDKEYEQMIANREYKKVAGIDLVKLLLGSNYLGIPQINYVKNMVLKSVLNYSRRQNIPSIIVFDDMDAAVAMKLDEYGYHIEKVVFKNEERLSGKQKEEQIQILAAIVSGINEMNKRIFEEKLQNYYQKVRQQN